MERGGDGVHVVLGGSTGAPLLCAHLSPFSPTSRAPRPKPLLRIAASLRQGVASRDASAGASFAIAGKAEIRAHAVSFADVTCVVAVEGGGPGRIDPGGAIDDAIALELARRVLSRFLAVHGVEAAEAVAAADRNAGDYTVHDSIVDAADMSHNASHHNASHHNASHHNASHHNASHDVSLAHNNSVVAALELSVPGAPFASFEAVAASEVQSAVAECAVTAAAAAAAAADSAGASSIPGREHLEPQQKGRGRNAPSRGTAAGRPPAFAASTPYGPPAAAHGHTLPSSTPAALPPRHTSSEPQVPATSRRLFDVEPSPIRMAPSPVPGSSVVPPLPLPLPRNGVGRFFPLVPRLCGALGYCVLDITAGASAPSLVSFIHGVAFGRRARATHLFDAREAPPSAPRAVARPSYTAADGAAVTAVAVECSQIAARRANGEWASVSFAARSAERVSAVTCAVDGPFGTRWCLIMSFSPRKETPSPASSGRSRDPSSRVGVPPPSGLDRTVATLDTDAVPVDILEAFLSHVDEVHAAYSADARPRRRSVIGGDSGALATPYAAGVAMTPSGLQLRMGMPETPASRAHPSPIRNSDTAGPHAAYSAAAAPTPSATSSSPSGSSALQSRSRQQQRLGRSHSFSLIAGDAGAAESFLAAGPSPAQAFAAPPASMRPPVHPGSARGGSQRAVMARGSDHFCPAPIPPLKPMRPDGPRRPAGVAGRDLARSDISKDPELPHHSRLEPTSPIAKSKAANSSS